MYLETITPVPPLNFDLSLSTSAIAVARLLSCLSCLLGPNNGHQLFIIIKEKENTQYNNRFA